MLDDFRFKFIAEMMFVEALEVLEVVCVGVKTLLIIMVGIVDWFSCFFWMKKIN